MEPNPLLTQIDLGGIWHIAIFAGLSLAIVKWLFDWKSLPVSARFLWGYVLIFSLFVLEWPALHFGVYTAAYQVQAGQVFAEAVFTPLAAFIFFRMIRRGIIFLAFFLCVCVWFNIPGLMLAGSFNSALAALTIPFIPWWAALVVIGTVLTHHASTALMVIAAQLFAFALKTKRARLPLALALPVLVGIAYLHQHGAWFDSTERLVHWKEYMSFWLKEPRWIAIGVGPGSFIWTSAMIDHFSGPIFMQMHNDWLQILWELGAVGLGLVLWVFVSATRSAWDSVESLAGIFGCAAFGLTYHPTRFFPSALLVAWIFVRAFFSCKSDSRQAHPSSSSEQD